MRWRIRIVYLSMLSVVSSVLDLAGLAILLLVLIAKLAGDAVLGGIKGDLITMSPDITGTGPINDFFIIFLFVILLKNVVEYGLEKARSNLLVDIRKAFVGVAVQNFITAGELVNRKQLEHSLARFNRFLALNLNIFFNALGSIFIVITICFVAWFINPWLGLVTLTAISFISLGQILLHRYYVEKNNNDDLKSDTDVSRVIRETTHLREQLKITKHMSYFKNKLATSLTAQGQHTLKRKLENRLPSIINQIMLMLTFAGAFIFLSAAPVSPMHDVSVILIVAIILRLTPKLSSIQNFISNVTKNQNSIIGIDMELKRLAESLVNKESVSKSWSCIELIKISGGGSVAKPILKEVNLRLTRGSIVAIYGATGSGKTTLLNLLMGLNLPHSGQVTVDNINLQSLAQLFDSVGFLPQSPIIFEGTILENITFSNNENNKEKARQCLDQACLCDTEKFRLNNTISEKGEEFSGGELQRLGLARALFFQKDILFLDEPTANLDDVTQDNVMLSIKNLSPSTTVIYTTNRKETLIYADHRIKVLNATVVSEKNKEKCV